MASIRNAKKKLKGKFKRILALCGYPLNGRNIKLHGTFNGYRWSVNIPSNPRDKIRVTPLGKKYNRLNKDMFISMCDPSDVLRKVEKPMQFKVIPQSDFLKDFDPIMHDVMAHREPIPFEGLIKHKNQ